MCFLQARSQTLLWGGNFSRRKKIFPGVENYTLSKVPPLVDVWQNFKMVFTCHFKRFFAFSAVLYLQNDVKLAWRVAPKAKFGCFLRHPRMILRRGGGTFLKSSKKTYKKGQILELGRGRLPPPAPPPWLRAW